MGQRTWDMGHGTWDMGHGTWNIGQRTIGHGTWDMGHNSRDGFMTINMNLDSFMSFEKLGVVGGGGWWWVHLDYNVSSGPFFEF